MKAVREVMKGNVLTIETDDTIKRAAQTMSDNDVGCLIVMENGKPVSIITERDIVFKIIAKEKPVSSKVREAMSPKLISIGPDDTIDQAANLMKRHGIKKLPVISYDKLIGIITSTDITAIQPQILDEYRKLLIINE